MSPRPNQPVNRPVRIALCLILIATAMAVAFAATAHAADYKMLLCAGNNGSNGYATSTNTISAQHPSGIFDFENHCGPAPDPAGNSAFLRIAEHELSGNAGPGAYGAITYTAPPWVAILAAGGYTREPNAFNEGWRGQFWAEDFAGNGTGVLNQGQGLPNSGLDWAPTSTFAPHLWPYGGFGSYRGFVFELACVRPAGCDRANYNAVDANSLVFILGDAQNSSVGFTGGQILSGGWTRGGQGITWNSSDNGSGLRMERLRIDGNQRVENNYAGQCNLGSSQVNGEFARVFAPCPTGGPYGHSYGLDTASLADGVHTVGVCAQDYSQYAGLYSSGSESCDQRTVRTDNTAPGAPAGLEVTSANAARYLPQIGAHWQLPPNQGSPISKIHYDVVNGAGGVVVPEKVISATNPTKLENIEGPKAAGDYRLRVWLEDEVGFQGPATTTPIPHDTTPPAAPQGLSVAAPTTPRAQDGFDLRWRNIVDSGSPIDAAHYQVLDAAGAVVVPTETVAGDNPQAIESIEAPNDRGSFTLRLWLTDAEGNVGAPVTAPLSYECLRSTVGGGQQLSADLDGATEELVEQGQGATLRGELRGVGGDIAGAPLCVFSQVAGDGEGQFLGIAITGSRGDYRFAIAAGPSRTLSAVYRPGQRQIDAKATLQTRVKPTLRAARQIVRTGEAAHLSGEIPGPRNDDVVIVLQVKQGDGWLAFRRYRTREGGHFEADYLFRRTTRPTTYEMRAQVRESTGYPYIEGDSDPLFLRVLPKRKAHKACPAGKHLVKERHGKSRCARKQPSHGRPGRR